MEMRNREEKERKGKVCLASPASFNKKFEILFSLFDFWPATILFFFYYMFCFLIVKNI